uniref:Thioredoxin domain-containing protein n=2 Tax=Prymnesium polylepis TaxID=72548 RepID=A0A7S4M2U2_9EUKA
MGKVFAFGLLLLACADAFGFTTTQPMRSRVASSAVRNSRRIEAVVIDISSTDEFNDALETAGDSLVVIDYSTSWCGPCKIIAPKFDELSEQYKNVAFLKVMGDSSPEADKLMRSQGVRALPSFHFWKNKKQVDSVSGAKTQALQDAIEAHM